jgi:steroid delta-isomerase-like uncharacterized protein
MTTPAEVARTIFDGVAKRELDVAMEHVAEDTVDDFIALGEVRGRAAIRRFFDEMFTAFPDFEISVERIVADDEGAAVQWRAHGTFSGGPFQGIEPTGRRVDIRGLDLMEIAGGLVRHNTIYYDGASFARQIGLLPRADSAADKAMISAFNAATRARRRIRERRGA